MNKENFLQIALHKPIKSKQDAKEYITKLTQCDLHYHLDDDVFDIIFNEYQPSMKELFAMDARQNELWDLEWDNTLCPHSIMLNVMNKI